MNWRDELLKVGIILLFYRRAYIIMLLPGINDSMYFILPIIGPEMLGDRFYFTLL